MIFTLANIINSIAGQLKSLYPDIPVYRSPSYRTDPPCFYIFLTQSADIEDEPSRRLVRTLPFDIVFVQQRNVADQNEYLYRMLDILDEHFDLLTYSDGESTCLLHCNERSARVEDQELHYLFTIKQRVSLAEIADYMKTLEKINVEIETEISSGKTA